MRTLRVLMFFLRLILGTVFILSGFFKLTDPVGTSLIVEEYLNVLHLGFLRFGAVPFGMLLSVFELLIGISVLTCIRIRTGAWCALIMVSFFTILTFFVALFDAVKDCGCFGQAIHLTPWQTFYKNIVLTICIVPVFLFRRKFKPVAPIPAERTFIGVYGVLALLCTLYSYWHLPLVDYTNFRVGANISLMYDRVTDPNNFETRFIYEKDGERAYFTIDSLPDDSWTYIDTEDLYKGNEWDLLFDMTLSNKEGTVVSERIINSTQPVFLFVAWEPEKLEEKYWAKVNSTIDSVRQHGLRYYVLIPAQSPVTDAIAAKYPLTGNAYLFGDYKTLITICRSNGGMVCIDDGAVVKKWPGWKFKPTAITETLEKDSEEIAARGIISQRLFYESAILMMFLIIIIFRYVCGIIYGSKRR